MNSPKFFHHTAPGSAWQAESLRLISVVSHSADWSATVKTVSNPDTGKEEGLTEVLAVTGTGKCFLMGYLGMRLTKAINSTMTTSMSTFHLVGAVLVTTCSPIMGAISSVMAQLELRNLDLDFLGILDSDIFLRYQSLKASMSSLLLVTGSLTTSMAS